MTDNIYCSMIHGGLHLILKEQHIYKQACCLHNRAELVSNEKIWTQNNFKELRDLNKQNTWHSACKNCKSLEESNLDSMRTGMNDGLKIYNKTNLTGPARIDLMFDISCNLACRTCNPLSSTYWQKHLQANNLWDRPIFTPKRGAEVIKILETLDLSNLRMLVFCGGETLLGQEYWEVAEWLADTVPNAKENLTISFQTNGTQSILPKNLLTIEKLHLVKLHISLDGIDEKFNYLRWPATWKQVTENILTIKENVPSNVMFLVEETISIFNLAYLNDLESWVKDNFSTNKEGDITNHTRHLAIGRYSLNNLTAEYVDHIKNSPYRNLIPNSWVENPTEIQNMLAVIKQFDGFRNQSFSDVFPEVANFYSRFNSGK